MPVLVLAPSDNQKITRPAALPPPKSLVDFREAQLLFANASMVTFASLPATFSSGGSSADMWRASSVVVVLMDHDVVFAPVRDAVVHAGDTAVGPMFLVVDVAP